MTRVFIVLAEHQVIPGLVVSVHETRQGAVREAIKLVQCQLNSSSAFEDAVATVDNWEELSDQLTDYYGAAHCYVVINEREVRP